jgi:hypothetical protein
VITALFIIAPEIVKQVWLNRSAPFSGLKAALRRFIAGLHEAVVNGAQLAVVIAVIGVLVNMMTITGFAQKLSNLMLGVADDSMIILLCLAALSCLVFGLGMPTPAAYALVAVVGAPALVDFGVELLTAHMFVFFFRKHVRRHSARRTCSFGGHPCSPAPSVSPCFLFSSGLTVPAARNRPVSRQKGSFMKFTMLGSGTPAPSLSRMSSGYVLEIGDDLTVFDHGGGAHHSLLEAGYRARTSRIVF